MPADKLALLCHIGGDFVDEEGKVSYRGGSVRLSYVDRAISYQELLKVLGGLCRLSECPFTVKYKHPDIPFGSPFLSPLVSVEDENDLSNMMEVFSTPKSTIPLYLSANGSSSYTSPIMRCNDHPTAGAAVDSEIHEATPSKVNASRGTSSRKEKRDGTLTTVPVSGPVSGRTVRQNEGSPRVKAIARKRTAQSSNSQNVSKRLNVGDLGFSGDVVLFNGEDSGPGSLDGSEGTITNTNGMKRVTRSMSKGSQPKELVKVLVGDLEETFEEDSILKQGQEFENVDALRKALSEASIVENFVYKRVKNDSKRFTAKCVFEGCEWRLHASKLKGVDTFKIKTYYPVHSCAKNLLGRNDPNVKAHWISRFILNRMRDNLDYTPKDITSEIYQNFGVKVSYYRAWRGRKWARRVIQGSSEDLWEELPVYCREVEKANPKSVLSLECDAENCFQRLFVALNATIHGFLFGCRPLLIFKATNILGRYPLVLLTAVAVDANDGAFPVAYAIVESDNTDNWSWFMSWLRQTLEREFSDPLGSASWLHWLVIISEEKDGLVESVKASFPGACHAFCVSHIAQRIPNYKDKEVRNYIFLAASAYTRDEYEHYINELRRINIRGHEWIMTNLNPKDWATSHFEGRRYNILTSNVGETFTSWISELVNVPIISIVQEMNSRIATHFLQQREIGKQMESVLTSTQEEYLLEKSKEALGLKVEYSVAGERIVIDAKGSSFLVSLTGSCSCCGWQVRGLPCAHALAVIQLEQLDMYAYCHESFTVAKFNVAYEGEINPVPDKSEWSYEDIIDCKPPSVNKRHRGRYRVHFTKKVVMKDYLHCSICQESGHNRRTCPRKPNDPQSLPEAEDSSPLRMALSDILGAALTEEG